MIANDLRLRESETTIAELLAGAGYRTGFIGKWHLDGGPRMPGYVPPGERRQGFEFWAANEVSHQHFDTQYFRDSPEPIPIKTFEPEAWTDLGIEFLRGAEADARPFFLTIQMGPPHNPYKAPDEYTAMYDPEKLTMRPNWSDGGARTPGREDIAAYYAMITAVDDQVGRILAELDTLGLAEDTIVLFSSDHGDMLGSQGMRLKRKPWEESIRVPGIVRYPRGGQKGVESEAFFSHVDFAPTLLSLCGVTPPPEMQGSNLAPVILGGSAEGPDSAFFQIFGPFDGGEVIAGWRGVRTARYMYARYEDRPWVLYDLEADPYEMRNLAGDPAAAELQADLEAKLETWMAKTGDSWSFDWHEKVEDRGRLYRHEVFYTVDEYLEWAKEHPDLVN
jgi:arylsulfatase A-like enzyme